MKEASALLHSLIPLLKYWQCTPHSLKMVNSVVLSIFRDAQPSAQTNFRTHLPPVLIHNYFLSYWFVPVIYLLPLWVSLAYSLPFVWLLSLDVTFLRLSYAETCARTAPSLAAK